jgi:hypothetical protein
MDTETEPRLQPIDSLFGSAARHRDPALLLTEARDHLSVVLTNATVVDAQERQLRLKGCRWLLYGREFIGDLPVERVTVGRGRSGYWEAAEDPGGALVRWPSEMAYLIAFLPAWLARQLHGELDELRVVTALDRMVRIFGSAPGFRISRSGELLAPPAYASMEESKDLRGRLKKIPDEFRLD